MTDDLRSQAIKNLQAKRHFWQVFTGWVVLSILFTIIWLVTGGVDTYFWPVWPIVGVALGVVGSAVAAFGPGRGEISESSIRSEMGKLEK
jgi:hypothetical protein